jgi:hypothetical protein
MVSSHELGVKKCAVVPAIWQLELGGSQLEASLDKVSVRPYLKNKLKAKGREVWLKW